MRFIRRFIALSVAGALSLPNASAAGLPPSRHAIYSPFDRQTLLLPLGFQQNARGIQTLATIHLHSLTGSHAANASHHSSWVTTLLFSASLFIAASAHHWDDEDGSLGPQDEWRAEFKAIARSHAAQRRLDIRPDDIYSAIDGPRHGPPVPASLKWSAADLARLLPPMPSGVSVIIISNRDEELEISAHIDNGPYATTNPSKNYLQLALTLTGRGTADDPYEVHLKSGGIDKKEISEHLARTGTPAQGEPNEVFFDGLIAWLTELPWDGPAFFVVDKLISERGTTLFVNMGMIFDPHQPGSLIIPLEAHRASARHGSYARLRDFYDKLKNEVNRDGDLRVIPYAARIWISTLERDELHAAGLAFRQAWLQNPEAREKGDPATLVPLMLDTLIPNDEFLPLVDNLMHLMMGDVTARMIGLFTAGVMIARHLRGNDIHDAGAGSFLDHDALALLLRRYLEEFLRLDRKTLDTSAALAPGRTAPRITLERLFLWGLADMLDLRLFDHEIATQENAEPMVQAVRARFGSAAVMTWDFIAGILPADPIPWMRALCLIERAAAFEDPDLRRPGRDGDYRSGVFTGTLFALFANPSRVLHEPIFNLALSPVHSGRAYHGVDPRYADKYGEATDVLKTFLENPRFRSSHPGFIGVGFNSDSADLFNLAFTEKDRWRAILVLAPFLERSDWDPLRDGLAVLSLLLEHRLISVEGVAAMFTVALAQSFQRVFARHVQPDGQGKFAGKLLIAGDWVPYQPERHDPILHLFHEFVAFHMINAWFVAYAEPDYIDEAQDYAYAVTGDVCVLAHSLWNLHNRAAGFVGMAQARKNVRQAA